MIVKNEAQVIQRCLNSVRSLIDFWVIADTGSTDGTQEIIRQTLREIPGELYERPWVNFAHNRNEVLELSKGKGDYVLFIDADERLEFSKNFSLPPLVKDTYSICHRSGEIDFQRALLINHHLDWKWVGAVHETPECPEVKTIGRILGVVNICTQDGNRSQDPEKFIKDIQILKEALSKDPENARNVFYLAETYSIINNYPAAIEMYEKRLTMGPPSQEIFWCAYQIGRLQEELNYPPETFIRSYCLAHQKRPSRVEPLFYLINHYTRIQTFYLSYLLSKEAITISLPQDAHFIERWMYEWGVLLQFANSAWQIGRKEEALQAYKRLLSVNSLPSQYRDQMKALVAKNT